MSFDKLGLSEKLVRAVTDAGYTQPTQIQMEAIPAILKGGDLLAGAQTGTGKTAGFTLPMLERLSANHNSTLRAPRALVLTPTRELAAQVEESVRTYGRYTSLRSRAIYGGVGMHPQITALRKGVDILVATPGRLLDHVQQRTVDLSKIEILVLDEADRMLDMGFIPDIRRILALLPKSRQSLLFSATFSDEIKALADTFLNKPELIQVQRRNSTVEVIAQKVHPVDRERKRELLTHLIRSQNWQQVLVFTRTKHGADRLAEQLDKDRISAMAIHGNKSQGARMRALAEFKSNKLQVLVATDIAARGIDIDQLPHVVNFDLPNVAEDYVHRIGRTGRAGATGEAISLVCIDERSLLRDIERVINRKLPQEVITGFAPDPSVRAEPIQRRSGGPGRASTPNNRGASAKPGHGGPWKGNGSGAGKPAKAASGPRSHARGSDARGSDARKPGQGQAARKTSHGVPRGGSFGSLASAKRG